MLLRFPNLWPPQSLLGFVLLPKLLTVDNHIRSMSVSSDTESESGESLSGWDSMQLMQTPASVDHVGGPIHLADALKILRELDICAVDNVRILSFIA